MHVNALIVYTALVVKCTRYRLPVKIINAKDLEFTISTAGWTEQLTHAIPYQINNEYFEFAGGKKICERFDGYLKFSVKEKIELDKFVK